MEAPLDIRAWVDRKEPLISEEYSTSSKITGTVLPFTSVMTVLTLPLSVHLIGWLLAAFIIVFTSWTSYSKWRKHVMCSEAPESTIQWSSCPLQVLLRAKVTGCWELESRGCSFLVEVEEFFCLSLRFCRHTRARCPVLLHDLQMKFRNRQSFLKWLPPQLKHFSFLELKRVSVLRTVDL